MCTRYLIVGLANALASPIYSQDTSYNDVGVIVNSNSPASLEIGNYFMAARNIPANRLITIAAPTTSTILTTEFTSIRQSIEDHLIANQLVDSLNYIVTTLGVPVRLNNGTCDSLFQISRCSSFDTEVALLLGPYADEVVAQGSVMNPYLNSSEHFNRADHGIYLVTRLAGPTTQDVLDLIDRSGPGVHVYPGDSKAVADINNIDTSAGVQEFWNQFIHEVMNGVPDPGPEKVIDTTAAFLDQLDNVSAYVSLTAREEPFLPQFEWSPGALAVEWMSYGALDYDTPGDLVGHNRLSNFIGSGATIAVGAVNYVYASQWFFTQYTLDRYLDTSFHFNAAESMYAGIQRLSWMYEAIGDPKTSIVWDPSIGVQENEEAPLPVVWPNPSAGSFQIALPGERIVQVSLIDMEGRRVRVRTALGARVVTVDASGCANGLYKIEVLTASGQRSGGRVLLDR